MKNFLALAVAATALSLASCSQEKTTEVTTTTPDATTTTTTSAADMDAMVEARAQRIADKMVADMKITDEATKTKIRTIYVNRGKRMNEMRTKYTTDTTGMAAAMREAAMETDTEFKSVFTDPTQYQSYESSRSTYDESNYMDDAANTSSSTDMSSTDANSGTMTTTTEETTTSTTTDNSAMMADGGKLKAKDAAGNKLKVKEDGTVKVKTADGDKSKMK
ncbi:hypothetical protein Q5H93_21075 [Hymenobacter sp. ASUV-10]|uniref:Lipoprotein n=1 Tax=Hymenobacter aranciens TaxID=3063996 RepID=A0ABT9BG80_9BACT|nr:hypothetical protein [Hymenobacter sp. ASUV-10]MDO7877252.1 hypothetical protein [Hymenobacter sp. ASUV-10]